MCVVSLPKLTDLSVRAFRQLRFNDKYAAKLEKRQQKAKEKEDREKAKAAASSLSTKANPFSVSPITNINLRLAYTNLLVVSDGRHKCHRWNGQCIWQRIWDGE